MSGRRTVRLAIVATDPISKKVMTEIGFEYLSRNSLIFTKGRGLVPKTSRVASFEEIDWTSMKSLKIAKTFSDYCSSFSSKIDSISLSESSIRSATCLLSWPHLLLFGHCLV